MSARFMPTMGRENRYEEELLANNSQKNLVPGLMLTILILTLLVAVCIKIVDPFTLPVRHVSVAGDFNHLSPLRLQQRASEVVRGGFFNVNVETIQDVLMQEPWVMEVSVNRIWPDRITVNIREQSAFAQWGKNGLLNSNAQIFFPETSSFPQNLPMVIAPESYANLVMDHLQRIQEILPEGLSVNELRVSDRRSWALTLNNGLKMRLGKENIISRVEEFFNIYPFSDTGILDRIQFIDMRYTNGFVIRWNPEIKSDLNNGQGNNG